MAECQVIYKGQSFNKSEIEKHIDDFLDKEKMISAKNKEQPITSPIKTENNGSEKNSQESNAQESGQKSSEEGQQKDAQGNVLTPGSEQGAGAKPETAPDSEVKEHTVKFNKQSGEYEVVSPKGSIMGSFKDEAKAHEYKDEINDTMKEEAPPPAEPATAEPKPDEAPKNTGIRDSIVNAERVHRGLKELVKDFTRSWSENWNALKNNIRDNGFDPRQFIEDIGVRLDKGERIAFTDYDYATLLFDRLNIQNDLAIARDGMEQARTSGDEAAETAATDIFNQHTKELDQNDAVARKLKSESGRALSAIQMMTNMDGELVSWTKNLENLYRGNMPESLKAFSERIEKQYKEKTEQLKAFHENELKRVAEEAFKKAMAESKGATVTKPTTQKKSIKLQGKELAGKIRELRDKLGTNKRDSAQANIFGLPIAVVDTALLAIEKAVEGGAKLIDAINEAIKDIKFNADKDKYDFIAQLQNIEEPTSPQAVRANLIEDIKSISQENDATGLSKDAVKPLKQLMANYIKYGQVKTLDELVKKTHDDLKDTLPDLDEKEIRDAFSGYGMKGETEVKTKSDLAKLREQARDVSKYQELIKKPAGETLAQGQKRAAKAAELYEKVKGYMREMGIEEQPPPTTTEGKKAVALEASKKRMQSVIKDLEKQISAGERKERNGVTPDAELDVLRAERDQLSKQLNDIDGGSEENKKEYRKLETERNRQLKKVADLKSKLETLQLGQKPTTESKEAQKDTPEIEALKSKIKEAEAKISKDKADRKSEYSKLESERNRQLKAVSDLQEKLKALQSGNRPEPKKTEKKTDTPEIEALKKEVDQADKDLKKIEDEQRRNGMTPEDKIKKIEDTLNRQIFNYEKQIKGGTNPLRPKEDRPTTKQIEQLKRRKAELKKQVDAMRADSDPSVTPQDKALAKYNESLQKKVWDLEDRIENKNFDPPEEKKIVDFSRNETSLKLGRELKNLQSDYYGMRKAGELVNRKWYQKTMSLASATKRGFVLSRISTFGRLGMAVGWNTIFKPVETLSGIGIYGVGKVTGFATKLNQQADRYGITSLRDIKANIQGEGSAWGALGNAQTWKDFVSDAKNGYSELSLMYGDKMHAEVPKELRDHWQNIEHGLEAFGRAHGAVKGIGKRMEFNRSYVIRKEAARRKQQDVSNPVVQASIGEMAYKDAMRSILMEDNWLSGKYNDAITGLQKGGFGANIVALTLQEMMPIVKIPTNLILNAGRATLGTPLAGGAIAVRGMIDLISHGKSELGISKLSAEQSDALLRNLRMGNVGMSLMLAGFFAPNMFGASHYYQKGVEQPDGMEEGDVKFFGLNIPRWLADNPYLVTMKIGASLRSAFEYYRDEKDKSFTEAAFSSLLYTSGGVLKETPLAGTPSEAIKWIEGNSGNWFWYSQVKGTLEPGILQEIAEDTDNSNEWYKVIQGDRSWEGHRIKRKPESTGEALKTGIPGLREQVEEK